MGFQTQPTTSSGILLNLTGSDGPLGASGGISLATGNVAPVAAASQATTGISLMNPVVILVLIALSVVVFKK
jgi:hypothetical protein